MVCFKYRIYKNNQLILTNWIGADSKDEALEELEPLRQEHDGTNIKIMEVTPTSQWKC